MGKRTKRMIYQPHELVHFALTSTQARHALQAIREAANRAAHLARVAKLHDIRSMMEYQRKAYTEVAETMAKQFNFPPE